jgi:hypothetical protein
MVDIRSEQPTSKLTGNKCRSNLCRQKCAWPPPTGDVTASWVLVEMRVKRNPVETENDSFRSSKLAFVRLAAFVVLIMNVDLLFGIGRVEAFIRRATSNYKFTTAY